MTDIIRLYAGDIRSADECCALTEGPYADWAQAQCTEPCERNLHPYTLKLLELHRLREAGYPFTPDDLSYDDWRLLGTLAELTRALILQRIFASLFESIP